MSRPFYTEFAWAYDLLVPDPVSERVAFIIHMLKQHDVVPGAHILDAGCGTGRYSIALAKLGFIVTGIDASHEQIAEAGKRQDRSGTNVNFIVADICKPQPNVIFNAILCRGVLNDLTDDASRQSVFDAFARMMHPGGVLILDVREWNATETRKRIQPVFEKEVATDKGRLKFQSITELDPKTKTLIVYETHQLDKEGETQRETYTFRMRCWTYEELEARLTDAHFQKVQYFSDYDTQAPLGSSDRIVAVASSGLGVSQP